MSQLKACPFCNNSTDFLFERVDLSSSVVICQGMVGEHSACLARGPVGVQDDDGEEQPGMAAAIREWNSRAAPEGYALVPVEPVEPTQNMVEAAFVGKVEAQSVQHQERARAAMAANYKAMLAAAQEGES